MYTCEMKWNLYHQYEELRVFFSTPVCVSHFYLLLNSEFLGNKILNSFLFSPLYLLLLFDERV